MLTEEFVNVLDELWEKTTPPLEKMYQSWTDPENFEVGPPDESDRCVIISLEDTHWHNGEWVMIGKPFPCYICGSKEHWHIVTDGQKIREILCINRHEPTLTGFGYVRTVCSIPHDAAIHAVPVNNKREV